LLGFPIYNIPPPSAFLSLFYASSIISLIRAESDS
jgi:hypothetical protein